MKTRRSKELRIRGTKALKVLKALSNTLSFKIMIALGKRSHDVSSLSAKLRKSQPYISQRLLELEKLGLIDVKYEPGKKGIRKICKGKFNRITIEIA